MASEPRKRFTVTRIGAAHEGDLEAALNSVAEGSSWELHPAGNGDLLLIADAGDAPATADTPAAPAAS